MVNYDIASKTYDHTRRYSERLIERFVHRVSMGERTAVLDFGCGTGNYLNRLQVRFGCRCCGVEPSEGMRAVATGKNSALDIRAGDHRRVPFGDAEFDFAFMTDVVHHVPDLGRMFSELRRVIKAGGRLCIVTESHEQIDRRFYNVYFPSLAENEKRRYPEISTIVNAAERGGFDLEEIEILAALSPGVIDEEFVRTVAEKNFSMFHRLEEREFEEGLQRIRAQVGKVYDITGAGETLIWLK